MKIGNDWINGRSPDPNMLLIHVSPFESEFTLNGTDWYTNITMNAHVIVAINGTEKSLAFNTEMQSHQSVDLSQMFGTPHGSAAGSQGSLTPPRSNGHGNGNFGKKVTCIFMCTMGIDLTKQTFCCAAVMYSPNCRQTGMGHSQQTGQMGSHGSPP